jgi:hypothetical protein
MSELLNQSRILNENILQATNQDKIAVVIQSWKPLVDGLDRHLSELRLLTRIVEVFNEHDVLLNASVMDGINLKPLVKDLSSLRVKLAEDQERVMQGKLWTNCSERLVSANAKLDTRLKLLWKSYVEVSKTKVEGLESFLSLGSEIPEVAKVLESLASLQKRSSRLPSDSPTDAILDVQAYCSSIKKEIVEFEAVYTRRGNCLVNSSASFKDSLILEDENAQLRVDSFLEQVNELSTELDLRKSGAGSHSYSGFILKICELEELMEGIWAECVLSLILEIQYIKPFLESEEESAILSQIDADQNRLRTSASTPCAPELIAEVNRLSLSIKDQIKALIDKVGLSEMPENVSAFIKKRQVERTTLEDLQGGVFEWLKSEGMLKHFELK